MNEKVPPPNSNFFGQKCQRHSMKLHKAEDRSSAKCFTKFSGFLHFNRSLFVHSLTSLDELSYQFPTVSNGNLGEFTDQGELIDQWRNELARRLVHALTRTNATAVQGLEDARTENSLQQLSNKITVLKLDAKSIKRAVNKYEQERQLLVEASKLTDCVKPIMNSPDGLLRQSYTAYLQDHEYLQETFLSLQDFAYALQLANPDLTCSMEQLSCLLSLLDSPVRAKIDLHLFIGLVALSERTVSLESILEPVSTSKTDMNALIWKLEQSRKLFALIGSGCTLTQIKKPYIPIFNMHATQDANPVYKADLVPLKPWIPVDKTICKDARPIPSFVHIENLRILFLAAGVTCTEMEHVLTKIGVTSFNALDFLSFLFYLPLFSEAHQRTIRNPLCPMTDLFSTILESRKQDFSSDTALWRQFESLSNGDSL